MKTPIMGWRPEVPEGSLEYIDDEPTLVTDVPRLLAESIHPEAGLFVSSIPAHPESAIVLKSLEEEESTPPVLLIPKAAQVPAFEELTGNEPVEAPEDEPEDEPELLLVRRPLRGRVVRAAAAGVFAFVALFLLVVTGVQARTYRELSQAWARVVAGHGSIAKSADPTPVWTPSPTAREARSAAPAPAVRTAVRSSSRHHAPRANLNVSPASGIIREVPF